VSFIPVFSLEAQEGRLFKPLAFTKTFSMFFAALAGVTLVPVLMLMAVRGKITRKSKSGQPIADLGLSAVRPLRARFSLAHASSQRRCSWRDCLSFSETRSEFMPPLTKATSLHATAVAGISIEKRLEFCKSRTECSASCRSGSSFGKPPGRNLH